MESGAGQGRPALRRRPRSPHPLEWPTAYWGKHRPAGHHGLGVEPSAPHHGAELAEDPAGRPRRRRAVTASSPARPTEARRRTSPRRRSSGHLEVSQVQAVIRRPALRPGTRKPLPSRGRPTAVRRELKRQQVTHRVVDRPGKVGQPRPAWGSRRPGRPVGGGRPPPPSASNGPRGSRPRSVRCARSRGVLRRSHAAPSADRCLDAQVDALARASTDGPLKPPTTPADGAGRPAPALPQGRTGRGGGRGRDRDPQGPISSRAAASSSAGKTAAAL